MVVSSGPPNSFLNRASRRTSVILASHVASQLEFTEDVLVIKRREANVECFLFMDVLTEVGKFVVFRL